MVYRDTVVLLHPCCVWGQSWWHLLYQTQNSLVIVSIVIYSSHWLWNLADLQAVIDSCVLPPFFSKDEPEKHNNGATNTDRKLTHPKRKNLKKRTGSPERTVRSHLQHPIRQKFHYVHIKCNITPGPDKEKLSHR